MHPAFSLRIIFGFVLALCDPLLFDCSPFDYRHYIFLEAWHEDHEPFLSREARDHAAAVHDHLAHDLAWIRQHIAA
jgi:hypothetical protein